MSKQFSIKNFTGLMFGKNRLANCPELSSMATMAAEPMSLSSWTPSSSSSSSSPVGLLHSKASRIRTAASQHQQDKKDYFKQLGMYSLRKKIEDSLLSAEKMTPIALELEEAICIKHEVAVRECDLWDDLTKSSEILVKLSDSAKVVDALKDLRYKAEEAKLIMEMAEMDVINDGLFKQAYDTSVHVNKYLRNYEILKLLKDPYDMEGASVTIKSGSEGVYNELWVEQLTQMYVKWAEKQGHDWRIVEKCSSGNGSINLVTIELEAEAVYGFLRGEKGIHRMLRGVQDGYCLSEAGLAAVDVIPLFLGSSPELVIDEKDVLISFPSLKEEDGTGTSGPVQIKHIPTGLAVQSTGERSLIANQIKAFNRLKAKILTVLRSQGVSEVADIDRTAIVDAWDQENRRYVFYPNKLVQDLTTGLQLHDLNAVLNGNIEPLINAHIHFRRGRNDT